MPNVFRKTVTVELPNGLHLVPCSKIAQVVRDLSCNVWIVKGDLKVDAKNVFDLMTLNAGFGTRLNVEADGQDGEHAVQRIARLFETRFETEPASEESGPSEGGDTPH